MSNPQWFKRLRRGVKGIDIASQYAYFGPVFRRSNPAAFRARRDSFAIPVGRRLIVTDVSRVKYWDRTAMSDALCFRGTTFWQRNNFEFGGVMLSCWQSTYLVR